jgi:cytochrome P450
MGNQYIASTSIMLLPFFFMVMLLRFLSLLNTKKTKQNNEYDQPPFLDVSRADTKKFIASKDLPFRVLQWVKDIGPLFQLNLQSPCPMIVVTSDLELTRRVLNDDTSLRAPQVELRLLHDGGDDVLTSDGAFWKHSRKGMSPAFSSKNIKRMNAVVVQKVEEFMKDTLDDCVRNGNSFDVGKTLVDLTISVISKAAFEYEMCPEERKMFLVELRIVKQETTKNRNPNSLRLKFGGFIPAVRRAREGGRKLLALGYKILESYRQLEAPQKGTVIDLIANNMEYKDDKERASDIVIMMVGGHDSTGFTLAWTLLELAKNPSEQAKLRSELKSLPVEDRINSVALNCVIKESMRFTPVIPMGSCRIITHDVVVHSSEMECIEKDMLIPKGSMIVCPQITFCRNEKYYKEPDVFKPSRWINPSDDAMKALMPFSLGRRNCIGQSLAKAELSNVLVRLCTDYNFTVESEGTGDYTFSYRPVGTRLFVSKA